MFFPQYKLLKAAEKLSFLLNNVTNCYMIKENLEGI
nr:MAG TPA: hypothetical protein [Caudoviricetes sp.]